MKIDVEAAEIEVINGAKIFIKETHPTILVENHDCLVEGIGIRTKNLLESIGYIEKICVPYHSRSHSIFVRGETEII